MRDGIGSRHDGAVRQAAIKKKGHLERHVWRSEIRYVEVYGCLIIWRGNSILAAPPGCITSRLGFEMYFVSAAFINEHCESVRLLLTTDVLRKSNLRPSRGKQNNMAEALCLGLFVSCCSAAGPPTVVSVCTAAG